MVSRCEIGSRCKGTGGLFRIDSWIAMFDDVTPRHSRGLQSIVFTLSQSVPELGLLIMILIISGLIFASLTYYIEMVSSRHVSDV